MVAAPPDPEALRRENDRLQERVAALEEALADREETIRRLTEGRP